MSIFKNTLLYKEKKMPTQRAPYIDLIRGLCVLGIVFIHTCAHSGSSYVPPQMLWLSLLLDVPAFFFITGMTMAYVQKDILINSLFKLSMVFTLLSFICNLVGRHFPLGRYYILYFYLISGSLNFLGVSLGRIGLSLFMQQHLFYLQ